MKKDLNKNTFTPDMDYDNLLDICTITVRDDFKFGKSLELEDGVILDFDENNLPVSIELLDISERLGINKSQIESSTVQMKILITEIFLEVRIDFFYKVDEKESIQTFDSKIANNYNIPSMELASA